MNRRLRRRWYAVRRYLARWWPDPCCGVGFSVKRPAELSCGELPLELDVEGRTGSVYLSESMWRELGVTAGWLDVESS